MAAVAAGQVSRTLWAFTYSKTGTSCRIKGFDFHVKGAWIFIKCNVPTCGQQASGQSQFPQGMHTTWAVTTVYSCSSTYLTLVYVIGCVFTALNLNLYPFIEIFSSTARVVDDLLTDVFFYTQVIAANRPKFNFSSLFFFNIYRMKFNTKPMDKYP